MNHWVLVTRFVEHYRDNPPPTRTSREAYLLGFLDWIATYAEPLDVFEVVPAVAIARGAPIVAGSGPIVSGGGPIVAEAACDEAEALGDDYGPHEPAPLVVTDHRAGASPDPVVVQNDATDVVAALAASLGDGSRVAAIVTADQLAVIIRALYAVPHCNRSLRAEVGRVLPPLVALHDEAFGSWSSPDPNDDDDRPAAA